MSAGHGIMRRAWSPRIVGRVTALLPLTAAAIDGEEGAALLLDSWFRDEPPT